MERNRYIAFAAIATMVCVVVALGGWTSQRVAQDRADGLGSGGRQINTGGSLVTTDIDTCSELATILTGQTTGTCGSVVFSAGPTFTGTAAHANGTFSGILSVTGLSTLGQATSSMLSALQAYFGATATSTFSTAGVLSLAGITQGSVLFSGASGAVSQDNANLFWDDTNNRFGIGSSTPMRSLVASSTASVECNLTDGATVTFDLRFCNQGKVVLTDNRTLDFSNETEALGQTIRLVVCQDGTGSRTLTWDSAVRWAGGSAPTLTTTANKCDVIAGFTTVATGTPVILLDKALNF